MARLTLVRIDNYVIDSPDDWRLELTAATQRLLGDTITLGDADWQVLTSLPGWTRAHVATHLAFQAEALAAMANQLRVPDAVVAWRTSQSDTDLHVGARRGALQLLEALDVSSATLMRALDALDDEAWARTVTTSQGVLPAVSLVVARLNEVVLHHIDLRLSLDFGDVDPRLARILLQWNLFRCTPRFTQVRLRVITDEGYSATIGKGPTTTVRGAESAVLAWLTGRRDASAVLGAEDLDLNGPL